LPWIMFCIFLWTLVYRAFSLMLGLLSRIVRALPFVSSVGANGHLLASGQDEREELNRAVTIKVQPILGRMGLPFIGETVSFMVGRYHQNTSTTF
jgi:hypothetical protein